MRLEIVLSDRRVDLIDKIELVAAETDRVLGVAKPEPLAVFACALEQGGGTEGAAERHLDDHPAKHRFPALVLARAAAFFEMGFVEIERMAFERAEPAILEFGAIMRGHQAIPLGALEFGDPALEKLTFAWYARPGENLYSRVTMGYLERMHAGISGEVLWKPVDSQLALGAELNYTKQRVLFGRPVAATQSAQIKLADMARRITGAQLLALGVSARWRTIAGGERQQKGD